MRFAHALLPHAVAKRIERYDACRRIGIPKSSAFRLSLGVRSWSAFLASRLNLLPEGFALHPGIVVDVGANVGDWSEAVLRSVHPSRLIAIEPNPPVFSALAARFASIGAVTCLNVGVGPARAVMPFNITAGSECCSFLKPDSGADQIYGGAFTQVDTIQVKVDTLDSLLEECDEISLLKIDVQGYERDVLAGAVEVLRRTTLILIEANFATHYQEDIQFAELHAIMTAHGFVLADMSPPFIKQGRVLWVDALYKKKLGDRSASTFNVLHD